MAYVKRYAPGENLTTGGGDGGAAPAGGAAPSSPAQPAGSGSYTDFRAYLNANGDAAKQYAQSLTGPVQSQVEQAAQAPQFQPLKPVQEGPFAAFGVLAQNWPALMANAQTASDTNAKRESASQVLDQAQSPEWAGQQTKGAGYTPGMGRLDSYLFGAAGGQQQIADLKAKYAPLLAPVQAPQVPTIDPNAQEPKRPDPRKPRNGQEW